MKDRFVGNTLVAIAIGAAPFFIAGCAANNAKPPPPPRDVELANSESAAESAYARGALADAASLYQRTLTRARAMDDPDAISAAAYNVAACNVALGRYEAAGDYLIEARDETLRAGGNSADVLLLMAKVALLRGKPDDALAICEQVLAAPGSKPTDEHRVGVHLLRGLVACGRGEVAVAAKELDAARAFAGPSPSPARSAGMENLAGMIAQRTGKHHQAALAFDREADDYRKARLFRDMGRALGRAGAAYESAGQSQPAGERYYRAARSTLAQGDTIQGRKFLELAIKDAEAANDAAILGKAKALAAGAAGTSGAGTD